MEEITMKQLFKSTGLRLFAAAVTLLMPASAMAENAKTIAFLMPDQASSRYEARDNPGFQVAIKALCAECKVIYQNANGDSERQAQQFAFVVGMGASVVVLSAVDSEAGAQLVRQANEAGVKVIAYDRPISAQPADFYISFDNEGIGRAITASLIENLESKGLSDADGGVVQINGSPTDGAATLIKNGAYSVLSKTGFATLSEFDTPGWAPPKAQDWMADQIQQFSGQIVGVVAANDGTAGGAIAAMRAAGMDPLPPVTGNDATVEALRRIIAGEQYNTISKPSEIVAKAAAEASVAFLNGDVPPSNVEFLGTPSQLFVPAVVTQDNLKVEIVDKSIVSVEELCGDGLESDCRSLGLR
jgi:D-xylose transport system substrate-binding protein